MTNKKDIQPRSIFKSKSAAERLLGSPLTPPIPNKDEIPVTQQSKKKELKRTTGYYRPEQVKFMRNFCDSLRKKFNNENIKPPLLQRVLLEIWDENTAQKVEAYLKENGFDKNRE